MNLKEILQTHTVHTVGERLGECIICFLFGFALCILFALDFAARLR